LTLGKRWNRDEWAAQSAAKKVEEYKRLHAAASPGVLATISACNIRNVRIFLREPIPCVPGTVKA
jgi:L-rhamnose mutarotase